MKVVRPLSALLALVLAVEPAAASAIKAVSPTPGKVSAPLAQLQTSLKLTVFPTFAPGLNLSLPASSLVTLPEIAEAVKPEVIKKAVAVAQRIETIRAEEKQKFKEQKEKPEAEKENKETALGMLEKLDAVFSDYSAEEIKTMPASDLRTLAGALLEQGRSDLPGFHAAPALARKRAAAQQKKVQPQGQRYRYYASAKNWNRTLTNSALPPGAKLQKADKPQEGLFIEVQLPNNTPVVETDGGFEIPLPDDVEINTPVRVRTPENQFDFSSLHYQGNKAFSKSEPIPFLGAGEFGRVFARAGAAIKISFMSPMAAIGSMLSDAQVLDSDLRLSLALAQADAGPQVLGEGRIRGEPSWLAKKFWGLFGKTPQSHSRLALVKEQIYGETVESLIRKRQFDPEELTLVKEMLDRTAEANLKPGDLRLSNIMIGTTDSNPERRAYIVDGGAFLPIKNGTSKEALRRELAELPIHVGFTPGVDRMPSEPILEPMNQALGKGVARSRNKTFGKKLRAAILYSPPEALNGADAARETKGREKQKKRRRLPLVTAGLVAANLAIYYGQTKGWINPSDWQVVPLFLQNAFETGGITGLAKESYTLLSSAFVHASTEHVGYNMGALALLGGFLEPKLGHWRVLSLYTAAGVLATAAWAAIFWGSPVASLGASGAIMALAGTMMVLYLKYFQHQKTPTRWKSFLMYLMSVGATMGMIALVMDTWGSFVQIGQLFENFPFPLESNTNHVVHSVGLLMGILAVPYWIWRLPKKKKKPAKTAASPPRPININ